MNECFQRNLYRNTEVFENVDIICSIIPIVVQIRTFPNKENQFITQIQGVANIFISRSSRIITSNNEEQEIQKTTSAKSQI